MVTCSAWIQSEEKSRRRVSTDWPPKAWSLPTHTPDRPFALRHVTVSWPVVTAGALDCNTASCRDLTPAWLPKADRPWPVTWRGKATTRRDYYHGFHHAGNMKGVIENDTVIAHDDEINMLPRLTRKAVEYIDQRAETKDQPFFLYVPYGSPHSPVLPTKEWQGKSGLNEYADFVMQTDDGFKQILEALDRNGLTDNTLVIFTSDNGCSRKQAHMGELQKLGHYSSAHMRGSKADLWDGGHRIPFIARWPGKVKANSTNDQLVCLTDLMATCSEILKQPLPETCGQANGNCCWPKAPAVGQNQMKNNRKRNRLPNCTIFKPIPARPTICMRRNPKLRPNCSSSWRRM